LGGVPLLGRTIMAARKAGGLDRLWVSTDDPKIAEVSAAYGVPVPWLRPKELAKDDSPIADAAVHLLKKLDADEGYRPDAVLLLAPTSPFRTAETIRKAVALFKAHPGEGVISVTQAESHPFWCCRVDKKTGRLSPFLPKMKSPPPRQKLPPAYALEGSIFLVSRENLLKRRSFRGPKERALVIPPAEAVDIDTPLDWAKAESIARGAKTERKPVFIIAEAGVNHNGDLERALAMVDAAKAAGADAVKFQTFKAERLVSRGAPKAPYQEKTSPDDASQLSMIARLELNAKEHRLIKERCDRAGIQFLSTPFDESSADLLDELGVRLFKLPSGEITNKALLEHVARKGKPVILSTGMSELAEVERAVGWLKAVSPAPITLLHCLSEYPAPADQVNLAAMDTLRDAFGLPVGYSDHTLGIDISLAAAARGAAVIEKHFTLDRSLPGPDHKASLEPNELAALVRGVRAVESALGDGIKRPAPCEQANRLVARRSLVAARDLGRGHVLARADLSAKRPGTGIAPAELETLIGRPLKKAVVQDEVLTWDLV
jgi:N-acetylneuraminate synthase/N,N'-diacetyllegionaminate synthase